MARKSKVASDLVRAVERLKEMPHDKARRTLFLKDEPFRRLQAFCAREKLSVSEVFDAWVREFLETLDG